MRSPQPKGWNMKRRGSTPACPFMFLRSWCWRTLMFQLTGFLMQTSKGRQTGVSLELLRYFSEFKRFWRHRCTLRRWLLHGSTAVGRRTHEHAEISRGAYHRIPNWGVHDRHRNIPRPVRRTMGYSGVVIQTSRTNKGLLQGYAFLKLLYVVRVPFCRH